MARAWGHTHDASSWRVGPWRQASARRCIGQLCCGAQTRITWSSDKVVMPTVPASVSAGAVITVGHHRRGAHGAQQAVETGPSRNWCYLEQHHDAMAGQQRSTGI